MFDNIIQEVISMLVLALAGALVILIRQGLAKLNEYLEVKIGGENLAILKEQAALQVRALQQGPAYAQFDGAAKKEQAITAVLQFAQKNDIPVNYDFLDKLIEEAVQRMKAEYSKIDG